MIDSPLVGTFIAHAAFWVLLVIGIVQGALGRVTAGVFLGLWLAGYIVLPRLAWWTYGFVTPWVAVLDIVLVLAVYKGDVRLT